MFQIRSLLVAALATCGLFLVPTTAVMGGNKIQIKNPGGFGTSMSGEFFRGYWDSLKDPGKMKGKVSDHLSREQIETIILVEVNIAIAHGPKYPSLKDELLASLAEGHRFATGPLPKGFDENRPQKLVVGLFLTKTGDFGLITRYPKLTVIELKGQVGVVPLP